MPNHDRVSRFTANALVSGTVPGSELVLYEDQQDADSEHHGGALNFANDGKLLFTTGEHFDAPASQNLSNPRGKIHRINPDGTVPTDNPFSDGAGPHYDSIWAYGVRNPYRASMTRPPTAYIFGDVGGNDNRTAIEEVNVGARGANFGWADIEGPVHRAGHGPIYSWHHDRPRRGRHGGFVYHGNEFASGFKGNYFFVDYTQNWIKRMTFGADGKMNGVYNFEPARRLRRRPIRRHRLPHRRPGRAIYYLDLGYSDRERHVGDEQAARHPLHRGQPAADVRGRGHPSRVRDLTVNFSSAGFRGPGGAAADLPGWTSRRPDVHRGQPAHVYTSPGRTARGCRSPTVRARRSPRRSRSVSRGADWHDPHRRTGGTFAAGDTISFSGAADRSDDGTLPASEFHVEHRSSCTTATSIPVRLDRHESGTLHDPDEGHDYSGSTATASR